ncbi:MAG TPA: hypothetical protein VG293_02580 [Solirubrobacteraceae bacterium]|nr:hypothetical protein [Solirubrobacteraceae bacterium]
MSGRSRGHATPGRTTFELERFELVEGERYEVVGRWSGVRGRVFMRPELTLKSGKQSRRLLADLTHKPWQAAEGDRWAVAFPCNGDAPEVANAELTVTPDITVPVKRGRSASAHTRTTEKRRTDAGPDGEVGATAGVRGRRRGLGAQLAEARGELEQLRKEHARLSGRLDAATARAEEARAERDRATRGREQLAAEREAALRERAEARAEHERVTREATVGLKLVQRARDEATAELEHARSELEQTRSELEHAREALRAMTSERDSAIRAGVEVQRELRSATAELKNLVQDRDQTAKQHDFLQGELKRLTTGAVRGGDEERPAERAQPATFAQQPGSPSFSWGEADRRRGSAGTALRSRALALLALTAAVIAVVLILVAIVY